jgi:hypothetical protein
MIERVILAVLLSAVALFGQDPYGHIVGRVLDASGAPVPGAAIRATNPETNLTVATQSDSLGNYEVRNLFPASTGWRWR